MFDETAGGAVAETPTETSRPELSEDAISDEALEKVFGKDADKPEPKPKAETKAEAKPATKSVATPAKEKAEASAGAATKPDTSKDDEPEFNLNALDDDPAEAQPPAAKSDPFHDRLREMIPDAKALQEIIDNSKQVQQLQAALAQGQWAGVEEALGPQHAAALVNAFYEKYKEPLVDRYLEEQQRLQSSDPRVDEMRKELDEFKQERKTAAEQKAALEQQGATERQQKFVMDSMNDIMDLAKFSKTDRSFVIDPALVDLASNRIFVPPPKDAPAGTQGQWQSVPGLMQKALGGDKALIRKVVRGRAYLFVERDKAAHAKRNATRTTIETQQNPIKNTAAAAGSGDVDVWEEASKLVAEKQRR